MKWANDMKNKTNIIQRILNAAIVLFIAIFFVVRIKTGEYMPLPLVASIIIVIVGISRIIATRKRFQDSEENRKEYKKIVTRSGILGPIIAIAFIALVVFIKLKSR